MEGSNSNLSPEEQELLEQAKAKLQEQCTGDLEQGGQVLKGIMDEWQQKGVSDALLAEVTMAASSIIASKSNEEEGYRGPDFYDLTLRMRNALMDHDYVTLGRLIEQGDAYA